jgi:hypothetical protein
MYKENAERVLFYISGTVWMARWRCAYDEIAHRHFLFGQGLRELAASEQGVTETVVLDGEKWYLTVITCNSTDVTIYQSR